jgi:hypothetical protein
MKCPLHPDNPPSFQRLFAVAAASWFVIGTVVERIRRERQDRCDDQPINSGQ